MRLPAALSSRRALFAGMQADTTDPATRPSVAVIQFTGSNATECVAGPDGPLTGPDLAERYAADVRTAVELFATKGCGSCSSAPPPRPGFPAEPSN
jgi:hypothetical protein